MKERITSVLSSLLLFLVLRNSIARCFQPGMAPLPLVHLHASAFTEIPLGFRCTFCSTCSTTFHRSASFFAFA